MRCLPTLSLIGLLLGCPAAADPPAAPPPETSAEPDPDPEANRDDEEPGPPIDRANASALEGEGQRAQRRGQFQEARKAFGRACDLGSAGGCVGLASLLEAGRGGPPDLDTARSLYEQACAEGSTEACDALGH